MTDQGLIKELGKQKELVDQISPEFGEMSADISEIMEKSRDPLFVGALIVLLTYGMVKLSKTEIGSLFWSHLIEKKNDWCPNVRFVNKEELLEARKEKN